MFAIIGFILTIIFAMIIVLLATNHPVIERLSYFSIKWPEYGCRSYFNILEKHHHMRELLICGEWMRKEMELCEDFRPRRDYKPLVDYVNAYAARRNSIYFRFKVVERGDMVEVRAILFKKLEGTRAYDQGRFVLGSESRAIFSGSIYS